MSNERDLPHRRDGYRHFQRVTTRWMDNDVYGHVNNVAYLSWFDTVVNEFLIRSNVLDPQRGGVVGYVVETHCRYLAPLTFPQLIEAGLRVGHLGKSSVRYEIAIFADGVEAASAQGHFVHVYVDRTTRKPVPLPVQLRATLQTLVA